MRRRYPHAYAQAPPPVQTPSYPQEPRNVMPPNAHGMPIGLVPNENTPQQPNSDNVIHSPYVGPYLAHMVTMNASPRYLSGPNPVLGANAIRRDVTPEQQSAEVAFADRAETAPNTDAMSMIPTDRAQTMPALQPTDVNDNPSSARTPSPTLKRKLSQSSVQSAPPPPRDRLPPPPPSQPTPPPPPSEWRALSLPSENSTGLPYPDFSKPHSKESVSPRSALRPNFGHPVLNSLFRREASRTSMPES